MIDQQLGASLDRGLTTAPGRRADKEIENFISRRDQQRRKEEGERGERDIDSFICRVHLTRQERQEEERRIVEEWQRSCEREAQERREALRYQWSAYHQCMARRMRRNLEEIVGYHERKAQEYARVPRGA